MNETRDSLVMLFTSPPGTERVRYGLEVARMGSEQGKDVAVVLMQDSVLLALKNTSRSQVFDKIPKALALDDHLRRRGYSAADLQPGIKAISYDGLVELVMSSNSSVVGSL